MWESALPSRGLSRGCAWRAVAAPTTGTRMPSEGMTIAWSGEGPGISEGRTSAARTSGHTLAGPDERDLIERAQQGDREAFETLVRRYDRDVLRLALNILKRSE